MYLSGHITHTGIVASIYMLLFFYQVLEIGDVQRHYSSDPLKH